MAEGILDDESKQIIISLINSEIKREGSLDEVLESILNSSGLFLYLRLLLDKDSGALLGRMSYFCDGLILSYYGLSLNFDGFPGKLDLFSYEHVLRYIGMEQENLRFGKNFPDYKSYEGFTGYPSVKRLVMELDEVLENPLENVVGFKKR